MRGLFFPLKNIDKQQGISLFIIPISRFLPRQGLYLQQAAQAGTRCLPAGGGRGTGNTAAGNILRLTAYHFCLPRQQDNIKGTSGNLTGLLPAHGSAGIAMIRRGRTINIPFPRVKGGYCGHGLGSLVNCRRLLSVSWRLSTISGLDIPYPIRMVWPVCAGGGQ